MLVELSADRLALSSNFQMLFRNQILTQKMLQDAIIYEMFGKVFTGLKEFCLNSKKFSTFGEKGQHVLVEYFATIFQYLKFNSLYRIAEEVLSQESIEPGEFFRAIFMEFLAFFWTCDGHQSTHVTDSCALIMQSIKNHMERNPCFLERAAGLSGAEIDAKTSQQRSNTNQDARFKGFDMSNWVIRESLIFLQNLIKHLTKKESQAPQNANQTQSSLRRSNPRSYFDVSLRNSVSKKSAQDSLAKTQPIKISQKLCYSGIFKLSINMVELYLVFLTQLMLKQKEHAAESEFEQISETLLTHLQSFGK